MSTTGIAHNEEEPARPGANEAFYNAVKDVWESGIPVTTHRGLTRELLAFQLTIERPLDRVVSLEARSIRVTTAVARFVWMIAGNDRLEDIAYYEPKVRAFTDDGLIVPGSSYGRRLFGHPYGKGQIRSAIDRIRADKGTRRAAAVIWLPEDAVRDSADIPCAFGHFYHLRDESLIATCVMRSNEAFTLLPFNIFEFTMLAEIVATELGVKLKEYKHWSASLHINESMSSRVENLIARRPVVQSPGMPSMPNENALDSAILVARYEAAIRHAATRKQIFTHRDMAKGELDPYWIDILDVLAIYNLRARGEDDAASDLSSTLPPYFVEKN